MTDDIVQRLRDHVLNRGGPRMEGGAWDMMLDAAKEIERLRAELKRTTYEVSRASYHCD